MNRLPFLFILLITLFTIACRAPKNIIYFQNIPKDTIITSSNTAPEYILRPNDLLNISVAAMDEDIVKVLNAPNMAGAFPMTQTSGSGSLTLPNGGFIIDRDGYLHYPFLGKVKAAGLSKITLIDTLQNALVRKKLILDPVIDVHIQNYRITVLGEVARPSVIVVPNEKISLTEALGMAGDLTIFGKRENILIIREAGNKKVYHRFNLNSDSILNSSFYYLQPNDLVYVQPDRIKAHSTTWASIYLPAIISGAVSFVIILFSKYL